jgi:hypothetical protein
MKRSKIIEHNAYSAALKRVEECHQSAKDGLPPENLKLLGPSGVGKTTLLRDYADRYPRYDTEDRTVVPVLYTRVPPRPTIRKLSSKMLRDLGSPAWKRGNEVELTEQLITLLEACRVELVLLDELQHLVDRGGVKTHSLVADWLKDLVDQIDAPVVAAGLNRAQQLDEANEQFARRFSAECHLDLFDLADAADLNEIGGIVTVLLKEFKIKVGTGIDISALSAAIGYATNGAMGYITKLLARVARICRRDGLESADWGVFSSAFRDAIWEESPDKRDPFISRDLATPLTGVGEPFRAANDPIKLAA